MAFLDISRGLIFANSGYENISRGLIFANEKSKKQKIANKQKQPKEIGGRGGLDPSRYGDWEKDGRCIDF